MIRILALLLLFAASPALAVMHPDEKLNNPAMEARAVALTTELRCVVCQNESVEESHADIARDLRLQVRKQILDGKTDDEIRAFLRARYGDYILLKPPVAPRTYILWLAPILMLALGVALNWKTFRRRARK